MNLNRLSLPAALVAFLVLAPPAPAHTHVGITFNPPTLEVEIFQGTSQVVPFEITSDKDIAGLSLWATPSLASLLTFTEPASFSLDHQKPLVVGAVLDVPTTTAPGVYHGTIHARQGKRTVPSTLKIIIYVSEPSWSSVPSEPSNPSSDRIALNAQQYGFVKDELVVRLNHSVTNPEQEITQIAGAHGGAIIGAIPDVKMYQLRFVGVTPSELEQLAETLKALPSIDFAAVNYIVSSLSNPEKTPNEDCWAKGTCRSNFTAIDAPAAWYLETGRRSLKLAIVDTGFDPFHEDLKPNIDPGLALPWSLNGSIAHGTSVAGVACARGNNTPTPIGVVGMAWQCSLKLFAYTTLPAYLNLGGVIASGTDKGTALSLMASMILAAEADARIVNISQGLVPLAFPGCPLPPPTIITTKAVFDTNLILSAAIEWAKIRNKDVLWVFAAGNECRDAKYQSPASLTTRFPDNTITVAAAGTNVANGTVTKNYASNFGSVVTVAAPERARTTLPGNKYGQEWGTSIAAPHVAGLAALVWSKHPNLSASEVRSCIVNGSKYGYPVVRGSEQYSFRMINAFEAVKCAPPPASGAFFEDFNDGDFTHNPEWTEWSGDPGRLTEVVNGELRLFASVSGGNGGTSGIRIQVDIPVDDDTQVVFDGKPVYRNVVAGCGWQCGEFPVILGLYLETQDGREVELRYGLNYGGAVLDVDSPTFVQRAESVPQNQWTRDVRRRIREDVPAAVRIKMILAFGSGWSYEGYMDNIRIIN